MLFLQKGLQDAGSLTSTTSNKTNRSNKYKATAESFKRKSDTLTKAKNKIEPKKFKAKKTQKTNNKGEKKTVDDTVQNRIIDDKIKIKKELIEIAVKT